MIKKKPYINILKVVDGEGKSVVLWMQVVVVVVRGLLMRGHKIHIQNSSAEDGSLLCLISSSPHGIWSGFKSLESLHLFQHNTFAPSSLILSSRLREFI